MESIYVKNLYFTGEILNIDGICGGYNLHFAWGSGLIAGTAAGNALTSKKDIYDSSKSD